MNHFSSSNDLQIEEKLLRQKQYFQTGITKSYSFRMQQLSKLKQAILKHESQLLEALKQDLGKSETEGFASEIGMVLKSITHTQKHLKSWMKVKKVKTPLALMSTKSYIVREPFGSVLIIAPFNYPVSLVLEPLVGCISAGNCAILKPSEFTPHVSAVLKHLIDSTFDAEYILLVEGGQEETSQLIHASFDHIFFTGSSRVGSIVMKAAAEKLVPVTLELGGKSPVIVDSSANITVAAKRIVWGKLFNNGQTCIAPDYLLVDQQVKDYLIQQMKEAVITFYTDHPQNSPDYGRIVNERHFDRLASILQNDQEHIIFGGTTDRMDRYIAPAFIDGGSVQLPKELTAMKEELFGPLLPIISYNQVSEALEYIKQHPNPLALYVFTENSKVEETVISTVSFGGGCVNDTLSHYINYHLPFGGRGASGLGAYHGLHSFERFSHPKSILKRTSRLETGLYFPPYKNKISIFRKFLK